MNTTAEYWLQLSFFIFLAWNGLIIMASIIHRKYKLSGQMPFDESSMIFNENWASGSSRKNWFTRIGGAGRCLKVSVNKEEVYIRPFFLFQFGFLPEMLDLEHRIPKENVISVKASTDLFGKKTTVISFTTKPGQSRSFDLYLTNENKFTSHFTKTPLDTA